jgi:hypothetical protein
VCTMSLVIVFKCSVSVARLLPFCLAVSQPIPTAWQSRAMERVFVVLDAQCTVQPRYGVEQS